MITISGNHILRGGEKIGWVEGNHIFNNDGHKAGYFTEHEVFDSDGRKLGSVRGDFVYSGDKEIRLEHFLKDIEGGFESAIARAAILMIFGS